MPFNVHLILKMIVKRSSIDHLDSFAVGENGENSIFGHNLAKCLWISFQYGPFKSS